MAEVFGEKPKENIPTESQKEGLWRLAEILSISRKDIEPKITALESQLAGDFSKLNLYERQIRQEKENKYWQIKKEIEKMMDTEKRIENVLLEVDDGQNPQEEIDSLLDLLALLEKNNKKPGGGISKRKQKIAEERATTGQDPRNTAREMNAKFEFSPEGNRRTTGQHASGVKNLGNVDPMTAAAIFYQKTADTHGGKVPQGKKGVVRVSESGKIIRKA